MGCPEEKGVYKDRYFLFLYEDLTLTYVDVDDIEYFYEHRFKEISTEDILNIKVEHLPKTWEEFCENNPVTAGEAILNSCNDAVIYLPAKNTRHSILYKCFLPSISAAKAHLALMQLHQLRDCYRQGWVPNWNDLHEDKYCITIVEDNIYMWRSHNHYFLSFQTEELAEKFLDNFRDLIEQAGDLI